MEVLAQTKKEIKTVLIVSVIPYFLEKKEDWFQTHLGEILKARKTNSFFETNTLFLEKNKEMKMSSLLRKLDEMGYVKVRDIEGMGEFSVKGGVVEIFPLNLKHPIRVEFYGNIVERIEKISLKEQKTEEELKKDLKKRLTTQKLFSDLKNLKKGEYIVHLDHGIGKFVGFSFLTYQNPLLEKEKCYVIEYARGDKLYVPFSQERKLSRYIGFETPKISRLGGSFWEKTKRKVKKETEKLAKELLEIYAKRKLVHRPPYLPDNEIDKHLESTFPYKETPDQLQVINEIKKEMETSEEPLDRIVCGDVGFGKTEVALRLMVKAVNSGYQTAMICPTTILAHQHYQTFKERLKDLPIKVEVLSRLQSKLQQKKILKNLKEGKIDIIIGTHRLLSDDVEFCSFKKGLGLLIIDDEHKFGVLQKEKLKKLKSSLDVIYLSATPIPRTLYFALSSLKKISIIQTPPPLRLPIKTFIYPWNEKIIKKAVEKELSRGGQVYYLQNTIKTLPQTKKFLENLLSSLPKPPKIEIIHGRLSEKQLVNLMTNFKRKKIDILLATTIIENGLDFSNANTLIVEDATKLGLAQAYQIRGRIGRGAVQSFAYFFYNPASLTEKAKLRLKTLKEAQELGCGYKIALRDLEIRGAGNILGKEQSGHVNKVGLNLYCQMLSEAIEKLKKEKYHIKNGGN